MQKLAEKKVFNPTGKTFFVEIRTFWHLFRSFDRMWAFYILGLQVSCSSVEDREGDWVSKTYDSSNLAS
jgi:hypothetical protein